MVVRWVDVFVFVAVEYTKLTKTTVPECSPKSKRKHKLIYVREFSPCDRMKTEQLERVHRNLPLGCLNVCNVGENLETRGGRHTLLSPIHLFNRLQSAWMNLRMHLIEFKCVSVPFIHEI